MDKILTVEKAIQVAQMLKDEGTHIVLVGGCFDILHIGHLTFLQQAKKQGSILMVMLEADETISKIKGPHRPINIQQDRAKILAALEIVDYIILLPPEMKNTDYDSLITKINPSIIATTHGDQNRIHKERQAKEIGAAVIDVTKLIKDQSTTRLIALLKESYD